jgi:hypothetical protein
MINILIVILSLYAFTFAMLAWGPDARWLEGWMIPHSEPQEKCLVKCGTCKRGQE